VKEGARKDSRTSGGEAFVGVVCGRGNNGGDGFVIARHLSNVGIAVELFLACEPAALSGDAGTNYGIVERMALPRHKFDAADSISVHRSRLARARVIVDAVLGTGFSGEVRPPLDLVIEAINSARQSPSPVRVVAIDVPSGLDCDTGRPSGAVVRADVTVTFVARKIGFDAPGASDYTGRVIVTYIGAPLRLIDEVLADGAA
jgi:NAD(P)H-hydrate epimerase